MLWGLLRFLFFTTARDISAAKAHPKEWILGFRWLLGRGEGQLCTNVIAVQAEASSLTVKATSCYCWLPVWWPGCMFLCARNVYQNLASPVVDWQTTAGWGGDGGENKTIPEPAQSAAKLSIALTWCVGVVNLDLSETPARGQRLSWFVLRQQSVSHTWWHVPSWASSEASVVVDLQSILWVESATDSCSFGWSHGMIFQDSSIKFVIRTI